jgi:hypothetical protein
MIKGMAWSGLVAATSSCARAGPSIASNQRTPLPNIPDMPVFNQSNAVDVMAAQGVDIIICSDPVNVYYLKNHRIVSNSLGMCGLAFASLAASGRSKPALATEKLSYFLSSDDHSIPSHTDLKLFTSPAAADIYETLTNAEELMSAPKSAGYIKPTFADRPFRDYETKRRETIDAASADIAASFDAALLRAVRDADFKKQNHCR